jgi:hypothetical protein
MTFKFAHLAWLSIVLCILKDMSLIDWPWWAILLPFEISGVALLLYGFCCLMIWLTETKEQRHARQLSEKLNQYREALARERRQ